MTAHLSEHLTFYHTVICCNVIDAKNNFKVLKRNFCWSVFTKKPQFTVLFVGTLHINESEINYSNLSKIQNSSELCKISNLNVWRMTAPAVSFKVHVINSLTR
jgi:hypothetical protein